MPTIQRPLKTYGTRSYAAEVAAAPGNEDPILANEVDADLDTIYAAWNGGTDAVNLKDGCVTFAKLDPNTAQLWRDTGTALTPGVNFAARPVAITGATNNPLIFGSRTIKGRLVAQTTSDRTILNANASLNAAETAWTQDDAAKASWFVSLRPDTDQFLLQRTPPAGVITNLLTVDSAGKLIVPGSGDATDQSAVVFGPRTQKGRLIALAGLDFVAFSRNRRWDGSAWQRDDTAQPSWQVGLETDQLIIRRISAAGVDGQVFWLDSASNLQITGATATKASGTAWANPSDRRLKDAIEDYATGLAAILQLQPRTFVFNGKGGSMAGLRGYGFIADEIAPVLPETVGLRAGKLDPDDEDETDIQTLDQSNLILALVNAVKELAARVATLEGAAA